MTLTYLLLHALVFFVPGFCACVLLRIQTDRYLISLALSYALTTAVIALARLMGWSFGVSGAVWLAIGAILLLLASARFVRLRRLVPSPSRPVSPSTMGTIAVAAGIAITATGYLLTTGPYDEVPADVFRHLEYSQEAAWDLVDDDFDAVTTTPVLLGKFGNYWYYVYAAISRWSGLSVTSGIAAATIANTLTLLLAVFCFSRTVFARAGLGEGERTAAAVVACALFALHFGVNVFSFIRYYALAPAMLNMVVYFAGVAVVLRTAVRDGFTFGDAVLWGICAVTALLVHRQEGLFLILMTGGMLVHIALTSRNRRFSTVTPAARSTVSLIPPPRTISHRTLAMLAVGAVVVAMIVSHRWLERHPVGDEPKLISLEALAPVLQGAYILNPDYQFYQVATLWGVFVYALFLWHWREFRGNPFLMAGMLSPLFTVFNPVFTDFFLRHSYYYNYWRFCYLIPFPFVGAWLLVQAVRRLKSGNAGRTVVAGVTLACLTVTLLPLRLPFGDARWSRVYTLMTPPPENRSAHWQDLLEYLETMEQSEWILTDPLTGYLVSALTRHHSPREKFHFRNFNHFNFDHYDDDPLGQFAGWLLIVNRRDGGMSRVGALSGHWPADALRLSDHYGPALHRHLRERPDWYEALWSTADIAVYRILPR